MVGRLWRLVGLGRRWRPVGRRSIARCHPGPFLLRPQEGGEERVQETRAAGGQFVGPTWGVSELSNVNVDTQPWANILLKHSNQGHKR